jgi:DNA polymerase-1
MILQVHDELVFEVPAAEIEAASSLVRKEMEEAIVLAVPVRVDIGIGQNWYQAH